jgi:hypothetical protein
MLWWVKDGFEGGGAGSHQWAQLLHAKASKARLGSPHNIPLHSTIMSSESRHRLLLLLPPHHPTPGTHLHISQPRVELGEDEQRTAQVGAVCRCRPAGAREEVHVGVGAGHVPLYLLLHLHVLQAEGAAWVDGWWRVAVLAGVVIVGR